ncbi:general transcription factor II-I repeat domain-containing protein 2 [Trichonephila clavipes]|nr:general transcription factor II-I repeat domain-containing protein 2 [Trichonephila clavipes]
MCSNITTQHIEDLKLVSALSIAVDESCDINDVAQVSLFVRFMSHSGPKEELLGLLALKVQTRGEYIADAAIEFPLDKIVSISTDGAKSMTGLKLLIIANSKNLFEMESEYADLLLHNKVRWLSRRNALKRFASIFPEIKAFLLEKGVHYPELTDDQWIQNFYFMVDITSHLNQLNRKLQGKGNLIFSILEEVITFENKSTFAQDFERERLFHFPSLLKHRQENNSSINKHHFKTMI